MTGRDDRRKETSNPADLRRRAEERVGATQTQDLASLSAEEIAKLLHELRVHQVELEMQNENLRGTQEALEESWARYFDLYDLAPVGYVTVTEKGLIVEANLTAANLLGVPRAALVKQPLTRSILPEDQDIYYRHRKELFETGAPQGCELRLKNAADSTPFWARIEATLARDEKTGAPVCRATFSDITKDRQAEEERAKLVERIHRLEKMETLGNLAGGVAHDLNNILGILVGYAELLFRDLEETSPLRKDVSVIMASSMRAAVIVQDLLTMARRGVVTRSLNNFNRLVPTALQSPLLMELSLSRPGIRLATHYEENLPNFLASPAHIERTLQNLVLNAAESMPEGGTITIRTESVQLDRPVSGYENVKTGDYVLLSVSDAGTGIKPEDMPHIFEPFYTKKAMGRSGSGLGLSVVWGTVKDHDGYIDVASNPGGGTTFRLYFPMTRMAIGKEETLSTPECLGKGERILVVDDEAGQRELAVKMLTRLNYRVEAVPSGERALEYLKHTDADLVVLDMIMDPGIDGLETYERIRQLRPGQKAILVSGFSETDRTIEAHRIGAGALVKKPYQMRQLGMAVRKELDRK
jgi:PAS domain S-box-containing protein